MAVFLGRTQALQFAEGLRKMGVKMNIVNTPREISTSCGLSVMFLSDNFNRVKMLVNSLKPTNFKGFYVRDGFGGYKKVN